MELENPKREAFALAFSVSNNAADAYRRTYGMGESADSPKVCGARLLADEVVGARVTEIRRTISALQAHHAFLTMAERRTFLALVVRTSIGDVDENSPLCQSWKRVESEKGGSVEYKLPCKLRAIELDAKLAGEFMEKIEHSGNVPVPMTLEQLRARIAESRAMDEERGHMNEKFSPSHPEEEQ